MKASRLATAALTLSLVFGAGHAAQATMVNGEVRKVDEAAAKVTIKHGPIKALDMDEGMTMVFRAKDPALLKGLRAGDKVRFEAERTASGLAITRIEKGK